MSRQRSEERRSSAAGTGGATGLIRSLGSAVGYVRRLVPVGAGAEQKARRRSAAPPPSPDREAAIARKPTVARPGAPVEADRKQAALGKKIAHLEAELERTYAAIAECTVGQAVDPRAATPALNELIGRQRDLKDDLFEARRERARLERLLARERRLQAVPEADEAAPAVEPVAAPRSRQAPRSVTLGAIAAVVRKRTGMAPVADAGDLARLGNELRHGDPDVRREAVARLGEAGGKAAVDLLVGALADDVERVKVAVLHALARTGGRAALDAFRRFLHDDSAQLRLAALRGLATTEGDAAREPLMRALEDGDPTVRRAVAAMLGWQHVTEAWQALCFCLSDPDEGVRVAAATALGDLRDDRAVFALIRLVADRSPLVSEAARAALRAIAGEEMEHLGEGLGATVRVGLMRQWWLESRVALRLARQGLGEEPVATTDTVAAPGARLAPPPAAPSPPKAAAAPASPAAPAEEAVAAIETPAFESLIGDEAAGLESEAGGGFESLVGDDEGEGGAFESLVADDEGPSELEGVLPVIEGDGKKERSSG